MTIKPMLAFKAKRHQLSGLWMAQPKIDGVRALVTRTGLQSRSGKRFANYRLIEWAKDFPIGLDGEIVFGDGKDEDCCRKTCSIVNSLDKPVNDLMFIPFDIWDQPHLEFQIRFAKMLQRLGDFDDPDRLCPTFTCSATDDNLDEVVQMFGDWGWKEGTIFRRPHALYKNGRSTLREGCLLALKPMADAEAMVEGFEELMHNDNYLQSDELGYAKRSSHKMNQRPGDTLGALIVHHPEWGQFKIGSGFTVRDRYRIWNNQSDYLGRWVKFKYMPTGIKDKPRIPIFLSFRPSVDMDQSERTHDANT